MSKSYKNSLIYVQFTILQLIMQQYIQSIYLLPRQKAQILQLQINSDIPNHTQDFDPISKAHLQKYWSSMSLLFNRVSLPPFNVLFPFLFLLLSTSHSRHHSSLSLPLSPLSLAPPVHRTSPLKFSTLHINAGA